MNKKMKYILIIALLLCFHTCKKKQDIHCETDTVHEIEITSLSNIESIRYGDSIYLKNSKIIKLESADASLIGEIGQIEIFDNKIYILESLTSNLLIFNMDGNYLGKIGEKGTGPGEYLNILSFYTDKETTTINIIDNLNSAIFQYGINGQFLRKIKHNNHFLNFVKKAQIVGDKLFCYSGTNWLGNNMYIVLNKKNLSTIKEIRKYPGNYTEYRSFGFCYQPYTHTNGVLHFGALFTDTIFSYQKDTISPYLVLKDKRNINPEYLEDRLVENQYNYFSVVEELVNENKYNVGILNYFENKRFILCDFRTKKSSRNGILWDKKERKGVYISKYLHNTPDLSLFISAFSNKIIRVWNNMDIEMFKEELNSNKSLENEYPNEIISLVLEHNTEEDNPMLILYEFKD
jgi:hypothetical protein